MRPTFTDFTVRSFFANLPLAFTAATCVTILIGRLQRTVLCLVRIKHIANITEWSNLQSWFRWTPVGVENDKIIKTSNKLNTHKILYFKHTLIIIWKRNLTLNYLKIGHHSNHLQTKVFWSSLRILSFFSENYTKLFINGWKSFRAFWMQVKNNVSNDSNE